MTDYDKRRSVNEESRNHAEHYREPWAGHEDEVLLAWSGDEGELRTAAELLQRTIEACRQRFYILRRSGVQPTAEGRSRVSSGFRRTTTPTPTYPTCPRCFLQHAGEC